MAMQRAVDVERRLDQIQSSFSGQIGFAAKNLSTGEVVARNGTASFPTASVIKVAVLAEVYRQATEGELDLQRRAPLRAEDIVGGSGILKEFGPGLMPTVHDLATLMIVISDNTATNLLIDLVGGVDSVNRLLHDKLGLPKIILHNRIDFDRIEGDVRRLAESSAIDMARLMELIATGNIAGPEASVGMIDILRRQQYLDQVPRYFNYNPYAKELNLRQSYWIACKTGFFPGTRVDAGIVSLPDDVMFTYCAMTSESADTSISAESEGAVTNGLLGRLILEYWWPSADLPVDIVLPSPYVDAIWD